MKVWTFVFRCQHLIFIPRFSTKPEKPPKLACFLDSLDYEKTIFTVTSCRTSSTSVEIWQNGPYNVGKPSRMLFWQFRGHVTQPIGRYVHICTDSKKIFVRGVVRGIYFEKSLRERLSPEGGQNWHDLTLHKCSNTCKSNQNTSLTQPYGRKQRLLAKSPLVLNHIPCYTTFKTAFGDRLEVKRGKSPCNHPLEHFKFQPFEVYVDPTDLTR